MLGRLLSRAVSGICHPVVSRHEVAVHTPQRLPHRYLSLSWHERHTPGHQVIGRTSAAAPALGFGRLLVLAVSRNPSVSDEHPYNQSCRARSM